MNLTVVYFLWQDVDEDTCLPLPQARPHTISVTLSEEDAVAFQRMDRGQKAEFLAYLIDGYPTSW